MKYNLDLILQKIIKDFKNENFVAGYQAEDAEVLGCVISKHFKWDGLKILETAVNALEDANFHSEADELILIIERIKKHGK